MRASLEDRPRYSSARTFETFPFPWPPDHEPKDSPLVEAIAEAACELVEKRDAWLNPPDASAEELKRRTLTNLYNARPSWLAEAHRKLDAAVFAAYGWPVSLTDAELLERLLALNHERAAARPSTAHTNKRPRRMKVAAPQSITESQNHFDTPPSPGTCSARALTKGVAPIAAHSCHSGRNAARFSIRRFPFRRNRLHWRYRGTHRRW